jgi:hypothetical protein
MQVSLMLALLAMVQDKPTVDDPRFKYWAEWKPGAWARYTSEIEQAGQKMNMESTYKLLEVSADKVVVEMSGKMKLGEREMAMPAQKQEIKAKESSDKVKVEKEGDEEIEVKGKKMKCHWVQVAMDQGGKKMTMKVWLAKEIPSGMAKSEATMEGGSMKMQAVEWGEK